MSNPHIQLVSDQGGEVYVERALLTPSLYVETLNDSDDVLSVPHSLTNIELIVKYCRILRESRRLLPLFYADMNVESLQEQVAPELYNFITNDVSGGDSVEAGSGMRLRSFYDAAEWFDIPALMEFTARKVASLYVNKGYKELKEWGLLFRPEIDEENLCEIDLFETLNTYFTMDNGSGDGVINMLDFSKLTRSRVHTFGRQEAGEMFNGFTLRGGLGSIASRYS